MGIETNFGTYVGKMDILSSLATLSFDERRSEFFTKELLILLNLIEKKFGKAAVENIVEMTKIKLRRKIKGDSNSSV